MTNNLKRPLGLPENLSPDFAEVSTELFSVLSRLRTPSNLPSTTTGQTPVPTPSQPSGNTSGELSLRDIPAATDPIKHKLQKARAAVKTLPDMHRTVAEQETEMRELEEKIIKQREVISKLRGMGQSFGRASDRMEE